jgi:anti-anti-sigma factor
VEISINKKGDLQVLSVKGKIRLQNWRVLDKHLETLLAKGCRWLAMDLSGVTLICSTGMGAILQNVRKFQDGQGGLMLLCNDEGPREILTTFGCEAFRNESFFTDWDSLEARLRARGVALAA